MIPEEFDTLRKAAERGDRIGVMAAAEHLDVAFERDRLESRRFDTMAVLLDQRLDGSNDDVKNRYREAVVELERRWIELNRSTLAYVQGEDSSTALVESADAVVEAYRKYKERTRVLETRVSAVPFPPLVVLWGDADIEIPKGTTIDAELALSAVGHSHPDPITIESESEIPASVSSSVVERLDGDEPITVRVKPSPATAGEFDVFVTATGETNADRFRITALVLAKRDYVDRAGQAVTSLEATLDSVGGRGRWNGVRNQTRILRRRLESISDDLEDERRPTRSIDNRLYAVRNGFEAMKRQISRSGSSVQRQESLYTLEGIIEEIDGAIEALP